MIIQANPLSSTKWRYGTSTYIIRASSHS